MYKVIFACVHNAGRSQMAAAFFNDMADPTKAEAISAGMEPGLRVHPGVLAAMRKLESISAKQSHKSSRRSWRKTPSFSSRWVVVTNVPMCPAFVAMTGCSAIRRGCP